MLNHHCSEAIRSARLEDTVEIARLAGELGYPSSLEAIRARLVQLVQQPTHWVAVVPASETRLVGWMHLAHRMTLESGEFAEIVGLVIDSASRRGGVGRGLLAAAESWSAARALTRITVRSNTVREASHLFYAAMGYHRTKSQHVYVKSLSRSSAE